MYNGPKGFVLLLQHPNKARRSSSIHIKYNIPNNILCYSDSLTNKS